VRSIPDIRIPHAIFVREDLNRIYVTDGGAGALKVFDGRTYSLLKSIPLKLDADSIGYDPATHYLYNPQRAYCARVTDVSSSA
jgi:DNA-binding beta-propeller fold protein YncE